MSPNTHQPASVSTVFTRWVGRWGGADRHQDKDRPIDGRVTVRTLILTRWIAIPGQLITILVVHFVLGFNLPLGPALATIGASVLLNLVATLQPTGQARLGDRDATLFLAYDTLQLSLLLYLTGGLTNPFAILLLAPLAVGAAILSRYSVVLLAMLNQSCLTVLALWHFPLPWPDTAPSPIMQPLYHFGVWLALSMSSALMASYVYRFAQEARRIADALAAAQLGLAREQRLSALGALAAAAAHELGTPLATIAVTAKELARDLPAEGPAADDVALIQSQTARCREILAELAHDPEADDTPFSALPVTAVIDQAAAPYKAGVATELRIVPKPLDDSREPSLRLTPEIVHGLGNLLQNALQFAARQVTVDTTWNSRMVTLTIQDDGPGFPPSVLARIGEPYLSARASKSGHMGLGIFIAQTLLERSGASVEFSNRRNGGACVAVRWQRKELEART